MKRLIWCLFAITAIAACLIPPSHATDLPMAECKEGRCTISEADWNTLREFHRRVRIAAHQIDEQTAQMQRDMESMGGRLARCQQHMDQKPL